MEFTPILQKIASELEAVKGIALAGMDGFIVAEIEQEPGTDLTALVAEHTPLIQRTLQTLHSLHLGDCPEVCLYAERVSLLFRMIGQNYFLLLVLGADGNAGKGRYLLRREGEALAGAL